MCPSDVSSNVISKDRACQLSTPQKREVLQYDQTTESKDSSHIPVADSLQLSELMPRRATCKRPNIVVPETVPFDFCELDDGSETLNQSPNSNEVPPVDEGENRGECIDEETKPRGDVCAPDSPVFIRNRQLTVSSAFTSPSLFDEEDERSLAKKQRAPESALLLKSPADDVRRRLDPESMSVLDFVTASKAVGKTDDSTIKTTCLDVHENLHDQSAANHSQTSPSVLSGKFELGEVFKQPTTLTVDRLQRAVDRPVKLRFVRDNVSASRPQLKQSVLENFMRAETRTIVTSDSTEHATKAAETAVSNRMKLEVSKQSSKPDRFRRDPDETFCPFQMSFTVDDDSLDTSHAVDLRSGSSPSEIEKLSCRDSVLVSPVSPLLVAVKGEPNGSLAMGVDLSDCSENSGDSLNTLTSGCGSTLCRRNQVIKRSESQLSSDDRQNYEKSVKRQRLNYGLLPEASFANAASEFDVSDSIRLLQGLLRLLVICNNTPSLSRGETDFSIYCMCIFLL